MPDAFSTSPALPIDPGLLDDLDLLVANEAEAATLGGDAAAIARRLRQGFVVTRGAAGSTAFLRDGGRPDLPAPAVDGGDTTGAGDSLVRGFGARLGPGFPPAIA